MTIDFHGKGTLKVRNGGFLSFLNKTTSRDFRSSFDLKDGRAIDHPLLMVPFPVIASGRYEGGILDLSLKVLGMVTIPIFHKQIVKSGDTIPIKWSVRGSTLVGSVSVQ